MPHLMVKQRYQENVKTDCISIIGDVAEAVTHFASINEKMKAIPRPAQTPVGQFERAAKDEWSWTAPSRTVVDRVLLLILNELETLNWTLLTQYVEGTSVTYIFNKQG
eukprot:TRINITY_DN439_c0_g3_i1.p1 TRINITY_DN439_c0_g3~~TRINITY_DN439_c0_g3_i1.p1  ORF type:complete len:108 (+),score=24.55 TRINITY_DN439_c0_g3_i1:233-556(+)